MITVDIAGVEQVQARVRQWPPVVRAVLASRLQSFAQALQDLVAGDKLGGSVLQSRTGALRASVFARVEENADGITLGLGSTAPYAAFQEFGFSGSEAVREHLRRITTAFGQPIRAGARDVLVHAYTRRLDYPAHSFLGSALQEEQAAMAEELRLVVEQAAETVMA